MIFLCLISIKIILPFCWLWTSQKRLLFLLTLGNKKLPRTNWMRQQLSGELIHVTGTPPWLLRPFKVSTSSGLYPDYFRLPTFFNVQASSFLIYSPFPTQLVRLHLVTYTSLCSTCVTYRTLCHAIGHQVLTIQHLPR